MTPNDLTPADPQLPPAEGAGPLEAAGLPDLKDQSDLPLFEADPEPAPTAALAARRFALEDLENPLAHPQPIPIHWAVGWADLMMTMFILFLVLYVFQAVKHAPMPGAGSSITSGQGSAAGPDGPSRETGGASSPAAGAPDQSGQAEAQAADQARFYDLSKLTVEDKELAEFAEIDLSPDRTVRIVLAADLLFDSSRADLNGPAKANIKKLASVLKVTPHGINVVGHTDDQPLRGGPFASNWELSVMRATTVARFLMDETGLAPEQFTVSGHAYYQPKADNDTPANRAKNRRVEIILSREAMPVLPVAANPALIR